MNKHLVGAVAGCLATLPMTVAMELMHRRLPWHQRYALPPRRITMNVAEGLGIHHRLDEEERDALTMASHFGYGAAMGTLYAPLARRTPAPAALKGMGYGLAVWGVSYLGVMPATGLLDPEIAEVPARRNALMIAAHLVWGATLGLMVERLERRPA